ncbi:hypothetical protein C8Q73DRAFT_710826 [Cubamyces lactineus]|nr:hypothetical protein C8Q73DRAFT_710826 [Cubamyces lactineus]
MAEHKRRGASMVKPSVTSPGPDDKSSDESGPVPSCVLDCTSRQSGSCQNLQPSNSKLEYTSCIRDLCNIPNQARSMLLCIGTSCGTDSYIYGGAYLVLFNSCPGALSTNSTPGAISATGTNPTTDHHASTSSTVEAQSPVPSASTIPPGSPSSSHTIVPSGFSPSSGQSGGASSEEADPHSASEIRTTSGQTDATFTGDTALEPTRTISTLNSLSVSEYPTLTSPSNPNATLSRNVSSSRAHLSVAAVAAAVVGCLLFLFLLIAVYLYIRRVKHRRRMEDLLGRRNDEGLKGKRTPEGAARDLPTVPASATSGPLHGRDIAVSRVETANNALLGSSACSFMSTGLEHDGYMLKKTLPATDDMLAARPTSFTREQPMESEGRSMDERSDDSASFAGQTSATHRDTTVSEELTMSESNLSGWHPSRMVRSAPRLDSVSHAHEDDTASMSLELVSGRDTVESCVTGELGMAM